ncbi:hypothetical protein QOZ80_9BG0695100 [Eleusine coracana subsp. coracana]|nr:hypothetical protein QOZ80_9BG0695100 [Eleusine coracana subsp. coracana]
MSMRDVCGPNNQNPVNPIVGLAADGLGFCSAQHAKANPRKVRNMALGLVVVKNGVLSAKQLEEDFAYHFAWGKGWQATPCGSEFIMQFPNKARLEELINFLEFKLKGSGASVDVQPWIVKAKAKARLHTVWVSVDNVPEEMMNYHAACEIGSMIGAVEEIDIEALEERDLIRIKVDVKSVSKIPPVIELVVKPFVYDIFFNVEKIVEDGWNSELPRNLGKRIAVDTSLLQDNLSEDYRGVKKNKGNTLINTSEEGGSQTQNIQDQSPPTPRAIKVGGIPVVIQSETPSCAQMSKTQAHVDIPVMDAMLEEAILADSQDRKGKVKIDDSQGDSWDSGVEGFAKKVGVVLSQEATMESQEEEFQEVKNKRDKTKVCGTQEANRRSERLSANEDIRVADKAIGRAGVEGCVHQQRNRTKEGRWRKEID